MENRSDTVRSSFNGKRVKKSKGRIENLGFFEEIRFGTEPGSERDYVDLVVDVKEAKTGTFRHGNEIIKLREYVHFRRNCARVC